MNPSRSAAAGTVRYLGGAQCYSEPDDHEPGCDVSGPRSLGKSELGQAWRHTNVNRLAGPPDSLYGDALAESRPSAPCRALV